jgi:hypothetical protein
MTKKADNLIAELSTPEAFVKFMGYSQDVHGEWGRIYPSQRAKMPEQTAFGLKDSIYMWNKVVNVKRKPVLMFTYSLSGKAVSPRSRTLRTLVPLNTPIRDAVFVTDLNTSVVRPSEHRCDFVMQGPANHWMVFEENRGVVLGLFIGDWTQALKAYLEDSSEALSQSYLEYLANLGVGKLRETARFLQSARADELSLIQTQADEKAEAAVSQYVAAMVKIIHADELIASRSGVEVRYQLRDIGDVAGAGWTLNVHALMNRVLHSLGSRARPKIIWRKLGEVTEPYLYSNTTLNEWEFV